MDRNLNNANHAKTEDETRKLLIQCLQTARKKISPIVDDIVMTAFDKIHKGNNNFISAYKLTPEQYNDIIWATQIFQDIDYELKTKNRKYRLPNSKVIVHNVSVSKMMSAKDNSMIIDEATVLELLQLYDKMGVVIHRLVNESTKVNKDSTFKSMEKLLSQTTASEKSILKSPSEFHETEGTATGKESYEDTAPDTKSTLSALLDSSSTNQLTKKTSDKKRIKYKDSSEPTVYIKIQCFSDCSEDEKGTNGTKIKCAKNCPSRYHVMLDGDPVMFKVNQNAEDGTVYCIKTGQDEDDSDIKIVIKQCPECKSTVIGSSTKIKEAMLGESHESVTLHGKHGDEEKMEYSDEDSQCRCVDKSTICISISKVTCNKNCSCDESSKSDKTDKTDSQPGIDLSDIVGSQPGIDLSDLVDSQPTTDEIDTPDSQPKMDVMIDTDNVDKSTVKVREVTTTDEERESSPTSDFTLKPEPQIPLTRRRICSSMVFDVTTEHTRLRDQGIEHANPHIVVELKKLGVDKLLRACRPARCCRKAILNERQRTALPYCVSLNSLPLIDNDIEVIKQSIDMSVRKIKNSMDLTQSQKDKLAFYVSLGRDDFRPNINFPWVIPVYDMNLDPSKTNEDRFFVLKKLTTVPKQVGSAAKLTRILGENLKRSGNQQKTIALQIPFILRKDQSKIHKHKHKNERKKVRFSLKDDRKDQDCQQKGNIYKRKNIWTNIGANDGRFIFTEEYEQLDLNCVDFHLSKAKVLKGDYYKKPTSRCHEHYEKLTHLKCSKHSVDFGYDNAEKISSVKGSLDSGDHLCSLTKIFDDYLESVNLNSKKSINETSKEKILISSKSMPNFWSHISEELFYASKSLTVFVRRTRSLDKVENEMEVFKITQLEEERWRFFTSKIRDCKKRASQKKLEYYVGLVNGDLVWSNTLPLEPQNYNTYLNYSNRNLLNQTNSDTHVEEPIVATRVTMEEASRMRSFTGGNGVTGRNDNSRRSTISELDAQALGYFELGQTSSRGPKLPSKFASYPMGPESADKPWAPLVASETSLPAIKENILHKTEEVKVETKPESKKQDEKVSKEVKITKSSEDGKKRCCSRDITIAITKAKEGNILVEGTAPKACNKDICEIYKNKHLVPEKSKNANQSQETDGNQHFTITAKDNIEIYINNQKIKVLNDNKSKKSTKSKKKSDKEK